MKVPKGMTLHKGTDVYRAGDELPPELEAMLPEDVRLQAMEAEEHVESEPPEAGILSPSALAKRAR